MANNADSEFLLPGNDPALDLLNTTPVLAQGPVDLLADYAALTRWLVATGLATPREAAKLCRCWRDSDEGAAALAQVKAVRDALRKILAACKSGEPVRESSRKTINSVLEHARTRQAIEWDASGRRFSISRSRHQEGAATAPIRVAEAVAKLLSEKNLSLVRKCENPACVLWFYDTSKNHARRWCSMETCGNRAKVAAHYRRNARRP